MAVYGYVQPYVGCVRSAIGAVSASRADRTEWKRTNTLANLDKSEGTWVVLGELLLGYS